jgi:hypothetical protein
VKSSLISSNALEPGRCLCRECFESDTAAFKKPAHSIAELDSYIQAAHHLNLDPTRCTSNAALFHSLSAVAPIHISGVSDTSTDLAQMSMHGAIRASLHASYPADNATCQHASVSIAGDLPSCCPAKVRNVDVSSDLVCQQISPRSSLLPAHKSSMAMNGMFNLLAASVSTASQHDSKQTSRWAHSDDGSRTAFNLPSHDSNAHCGESSMPEASRTTARGFSADVLTHSALSCESLAAWDEEPALLFNSAAEELLNIHGS